MGSWCVLGACGAEETGMAEKFSYSKLDTYHQCGYKYKLKYVDGNYSYTDSIATEFGTLIHSIEESMLNTLKAGEAINYTKLKNQFLLSALQLQNKYPVDFMALDKSNRTYADKMYEYLLTGIYRLENFLKEHPTYTIIGSEIPFNFTYNSYLFKGFIDRVFFDTTTETYIIQDIKTYAVPVEEAKLKTPLQFVVYALAIESIYSSTKICCQYDLPLCNLVQDAGTKGFVERGKKQLDKLFAHIEAKEFIPSPSPLCAWCEYCANSAAAADTTKYLCPYFCQWTKENKTFDKMYDWAGPENDAVIVEAYKQEVAASLRLQEQLNTNK